MIINSIHIIFGSINLRKQVVSIKKETLTIRQGFAILVIKLKCLLFGYGQVA